eukprot:Skav232345  [mRNA]  locus=scaffold2646:123125:129487:+ [translate_table: standard]
MDHYSTSWRCKYCGRTNPESGYFCGGCGAPWQSAVDKKFYQPRAKTPDWKQWRQHHGHSQGQWNQQQWVQQPRPKTTDASPKPKKQPKSKDKDKEKNKDKDKKTKALEGKTKEPAWKAPETPGSSSNAQPPPSANASAAELQLKSLALALSKSELPLTDEIKGLMADIHKQSAQDATKALHSAVSKLGNARSHLHSIKDSRRTLHTAWHSYVTAAVERWEQNLKDFQEQDMELKDQTKSAMETFHQAKHTLEIAKELALKENPSLNSTIEVSDDEMEADLGTPAVEHIQSVLDSLRSVKTKAEEIMQADMRANKQLKTPFGPVAVNSAEESKETPGVPGNAAAFSSMPSTTPFGPSCLRGDHCRAHGEHPSRLRFSADVELFIGEEHNLRMFRTLCPHDALSTWDGKPWSIESSECPHFEESQDHEEVSLLAHVPHAHLPRGHADLARPPDPPHEQPGPAPVDPEDRYSPHLERDPGAGIADEAREVDELETMDPPSSPSSEPSDTHHRSWQSVQVLRTDCPPRDFRIRWDDYEIMLRDLSAQLRIPWRSIMTVYEVSQGPQDLAESDITPIIIRRTHDLVPGDPLQMVMFDIEFHNIWPAATFELVRCVKICAASLTRQGVIDILGLQPYCHVTRNRCLLWLNQKLVPAQHGHSLALKHGDYVRVAVPPWKDSATGSCDITTRHLAAMAQFGVPPSHFRRHWQRYDDTEFLDHTPVKRTRIEETKYVPPLIYDDADASDDHGSLMQDRDDALHDIAALWRLLAVARADEQSRTVTFMSYYLSGQQIPKCDQPRAITFPEDQSTWTHLIQDAWRDLFDMQVDFTIFVVSPEPPHNDDEEVQGHIIVLQHPVADFRCVQISSRIAADRWHHSAVLARPNLNRFAVIILANLGPLCFRETIHYHCTVFIGDHGVLDSATNRQVHDGEAFRVMAVDQDQPGALAMVHSISSVSEPMISQALRMARQTFADEYRHDEPVPVKTWYLHHGRRLRCDNYRIVLLSAIASEWLTEVATVWADSIDHLIPIEAFHVHPHPHEDDEAPRAAHILLVQGRDQGDPRSDFILSWRQMWMTNMIAVAGLPRINAGMLMWYAGLSDICGPGPSDHECTFWHGDRQLEPDIDYMPQPGHSFFIRAWPRRTDSADDSVAQAPVLLQLEALLHPIKVPVRLVNAGDHHHLPDIIEVDKPGTSQDVANELVHWGHDCPVVQFGQLDLFACLPKGHVADGLFHYMFYPMVDLNCDHVSLHSWHCRLQERELMSHLHALGFLRAVIMEQIELPDNWIKIGFHDNKPTLEQTVKDPHDHQWPLPQHRGSRQQLCPHFVEHAHPGPVQITLGPAAPELRELPESGQVALCQHWQHLDLPEVTKEALARTDPVADDFDRYIIYTDGSSYCSQRHLPCERAEETFGADTWAFLVLGERYNPGPGQQSLVFLGWTSQPIIYQADSQAFLGTAALGADHAEREGLSWAAIWRLGQDDQRDTVFRTDSLVTKGQADGSTGASHMGEPFYVLRGLFQTLEAALPHGAVLIDHIHGHQGEPWNEFVDVAAKYEHRWPQYLPRQQLDMRKWRPQLPHLWMRFASDAGLPAFDGRTFDAHAPDMPPPLAPAAEVNTSSEDRSPTVTSGTWTTLSASPFF